ncbi:MAG: carbohydrate ABC transporter permease [Fimbriimonadaceae bacterium]|nr:carbohydrate ABC transporter permease [Fimbriimonadaceae bacterium]
MDRSQNDAERWRKAAARGRIVERLGRAGLAVVLVVGSLLFLLPFYVMVAISLKTPQEISLTSPWTWPAEPQWGNYVYVLTHPLVSFARLFLNTALISGIVTVGVTLSSALTAYPFARMRFRGRDRLFILLLATMMLPGAVTMIPSYQLWAWLRWIDTWLPLTVPAFLGAPFFVFLCRQFMLGIPTEMDEAATLEGAGDLRIFWQILVPNMKPVLATVAVFTLVGTWKDVLGPLLILNSPEKQTLELGLRTFQTLSRVEWQYIMAGAVIAVLPLIVIFIAAQKVFIKGLSLTGGK